MEISDFPTNGLDLTEWAAYTYTFNDAVTVALDGVCELDASEFLNESLSDATTQDLLALVEEAQARLTQLDVALRSTPAVVLPFRPPQRRTT